MDHLKGKLVGMGKLVCSGLQGKQIIRAQVSFIVGGTLAFKDRFLKLICHFGLSGLSGTGDAITSLNWPTRLRQCSAAQGPIQCYIKCPDAFCAAIWLVTIEARERPYGVCLEKVKGLTPCRIAHRRKSRAPIHALVLRVNGQSHAVRTLTPLPGNICRPESYGRYLRPLAWRNWSIPLA